MSGGGGLNVRSGFYAPPGLAVTCRGTDLLLLAVFGASSGPLILFWNARDAVSLGPCCRQAVNGER